MSLTILSVGYPLAAVSPNSAGGAEQILAALDRALVAAGHRSIVVAPAGSRVAGHLHAIAPVPDGIDPAAQRRAQDETATAIAAVRAREAVDLIHLHGIDFPAYHPAPGVPVLATLHLPPDWYPAEALRGDSPDTWLHCVSEAQHATCPPSPRLLPPLPNGVPLERLTARHAKRNFALFLGRICPEKGVHLAIAAARAAGVPLLIAGQVYPYPDHQRYFDEAVRPALGPGCRFLGPVGFARKRRLLSAARCLLVPSLAAETSSLVAREAAACGTAVIAFPNGAMTETVEHGRTGFIVDDVAGMAAEIGNAGRIAPEACRAVAAARFSEAVMVDRYLALYSQLSGRA
ncbi:glycosyltransferase [Lichenihabitans sp. Uapishka_5]|uniref:glycosyltransferase n=1 Tax=Lichenihabitans sp. Uapishka_5 TaxID=3037302 RepID=UPI0029E81BD2|nr:glycosyltransferase [Lichenihabitans sp. Uapishka_5]MDX7952034.1 glycosyltransferase [Lichenihabitans sp. Uapishka_5]